jgi:hypothetical protein
MLSFKIINLIYMIGRSFNLETFSFNHKTNKHRDEKFAQYV